ncbi:antitoxin [Gordonia sp. (in: high G+C Gram-positive bacteria)]|uniref:antitoxin n=1 Tax=Gordonia sp. (in: high G+C Gram-positive bacteria) TaxID=84139 RepID=UPI003F9ABDC5
MDLKGLVDKAKNALSSNPKLIEKGGDAVDKATGNKYSSQIDKAQNAARKAVGAEGDQQGGQGQQGQNPQGQQGQNPDGQQPGGQQ